MNWLLARLREPSTWRGLVWLLTALGVSLSPDAWAHITTIGMAAAGLIGAITREEPTQVEIQLPPIDLIGKSQAGWADAQPSPSPVRTDPAADQLRRPVRPHSNTVESTDHDGADFPGWGS
jgi:hypothetical protein